MVGGSQPLSMRQLRPLLLIAAIDIAWGSSHSESCGASCDADGIGSVLLQASSKLSPAVVAGTARATMPPHLFQFGLQLLHTEEMLDTFVANTVVETQVYAGVSMSIRMLEGDGVDFGDPYGLSSLGQTFEATGAGQHSGGMMSMLDIGGYYGRASIAAFKQFPNNLRIITVEPDPTNFLLLRWNLHVNGVPELELQDIYYNISKPGVLLLNHGIGNVDDKVSGFCYKKPFHLQDRHLRPQAELCDCPAGQANCVQVVSKSLNTLVTMFGGDELTLLKMDCEGCEADMIPALMRLQATRSLRIHRLAGELHGMPNEYEDFACMSGDGGKWFVSICKQQGFTYRTFSTRDRCQQGPARQSCSRIPYAELRAKHPPPAKR